MTLEVFERHTTDTLASAPAEVEDAAIIEQRGATYAETCIRAVVVAALTATAPDIKPVTAKTNITLLIRGPIDAGLEQD